MFLFFILFTVFEPQRDGNDRNSISFNDIVNNSSLAKLNNSYA